ncbi:DNA-directed RNA polymerase subunit omega [Ignatzschineria sp. LJL83]
MARVTVQDCLEKVDNRFQLVTVAAKRARQLERGAEATVARTSRASKSAVIALREIAKGDITAAEIKAKELEHAAGF